MKERPILFSAPMVRALLAGTKTQTRRIIKPAPREDISIGGVRGLVVNGQVTDADGWAAWNRCLYGRPGDRLWVREAWRSGRLTDRFPPREMTPHPVWYEADGQAPDACNGKLRPGMFMPRWASRITLEVTGVRVERLQDISDADAVAEGIGLNEHAIGVPLTNPAGETMPRATYRVLWDSINGAGAWERNCWVWVVEFRRLP